MRRNLWLGSFVVLFLFLLISASATQATSIPIRSGSGYGPGSSFSDCVNGTVGTGFPCESDLLTPIGTFSFGGQTVGITQFVFGAGNSPGQAFDIFELGSMSAGTTFSLSSSFFNPATAEVFSCGEVGDPLSGGFFAVFDSNNHSLGVACTPDLTSSPVIANADGSFTTTQDILDLVLDVPVSSTSTPEPVSLSLLGAGLVVLSAKLRRKLT